MTTPRAVSLACWPAPVARPRRRGRGGRRGGPDPAPRQGRHGRPRLLGPPGPGRQGRPPAPRRDGRGGPQDPRAAHGGDRPRRQDGPAGPDRLARAPDRGVHDRVRPPGPRDGDDPGRARLHPVAGRGAGRREVDRRPPGVHHPAQGAALPDPGRAGPGRAREPRALRDRPRRLAQLAGAEAQRHRQGLPARRAGQGREGPATGEPTGILRNLTRYVKATSSERKPTEQDQDRRLLELFHDYNSVGLTAVIDRNAGDGGHRPLPAAARGRVP